MVVEKPWGQYEDMIRTAKYVVKTLTVNPGGSTSLQLHRKRQEFWLITEGEADIQLGLLTTRMVAGQTVTVHRREKHRIINNGTAPVKILEVQYGECSEDDIERLEDQYGRG